MDAYLGSLKSKIPKQGKIMETLENILYKWKPEATDEMSSHLKRISAVNQTAKDTLSSHPVFSTWEGAAGDRAKTLKNRFSNDLENHSESSLTAAYKIDQLGSEMRGVQNQTQQILDEAQHKDVNIDLASGVVSPANKVGVEHVGEMQNRVNQVIAQANNLKFDIKTTQVMDSKMMPEWYPGEGGCLIGKNPDGSCRGHTFKNIKQDITCGIALSEVIGGLLEGVEEAKMAVKVAGGLWELIKVLRAATRADFRKLLGKIGAGVADIDLLSAACNIGTGVMKDLGIEVKLLEKLRE